MTESVSTIETNRIPEKVDEVVDVYLKLIEDRLPDLLEPPQVC
jgi:hypothetical protein